MTVFRRISGWNGTVDGVNDPSKWLERSKESADWDEWRVRSRGSELGSSEFGSSEVR